MLKDQEYLEIFLRPIEVAKRYRPKLGLGSQAGISAQEFETLYEADPFYHWLGLDAPEIYTAHRLAGGITSLYRQIGIGCERLLCRILQDALFLDPSNLKWGYEITEGAKKRFVHLDAGVLFARIRDSAIQTRLREWSEAQMRRSGTQIAPIGIVFEIRQGYKSKDSKRQNADIQSASRAYQNGYLPCMLVLSQQIDADVKSRYQNAGWVMLIGNLALDEYQSTYTFFHKVIGYDLSEFFNRNREHIRQRILEVVHSLWQPETD